MTETQTPYGDDFRRVRLRRFEAEKTAWLPVDMARLGTMVVVDEEVGAPGYRYQIWRVAVVYKPQNAPAHGRVRGTFRQGYGNEPLT